MLPLFLVKIEGSFFLTGSGQQPAQAAAPRDQPNKSGMVCVRGSVSVRDEVTTGFFDFGTPTKVDNLVKSAAKGTSMCTAIRSVLQAMGKELSANCFHFCYKGFYPLDLFFWPMDLVKEIVGIPPCSLSCRLAFFGICG